MICFAFRRRKHMQLSKRPLGSSGVMITSVCFGSWAIGGGGWSFGWGPQDDEASLATHAACSRIGYQLDQHRRSLRLGPLRRSRWQTAKAASRLRPAFGVYQRRADLGRAKPYDPAESRAETAIDPPGMRGVAAPAWRRAHRPLPIPLAR